MNKFDFIIHALDYFPKQAFSFAAHPVIWEVIEKIYYSERMQKRLGNIDTTKNFVRWLAQNPAILYRMVRLAARRSHKKVNHGLYEHLTSRLRHGIGCRASSYPCYGTGAAPRAV